MAVRGCSPGPLWFWPIGPSGHRPRPTHRRTGGAAGDRVRSAHPLPTPRDVSQDAGSGSDTDGHQARRRSSAAPPGVIGACVSSPTPLIDPGIGGVIPRPPGGRTAELRALDSKAPTFVCEPRLDDQPRSPVRVAAARTRTYRPPAVAVRPSQGPTWGSAGPMRNSRLQSLHQLFSSQPTSETGLSQ